MFLLGFLLMLSISFGEMFNLKKASLNQDVKNLMTFLFIFSGLFLTIVIFAFNFEKNSHYSKDLFLDWRLYIGIIAEICGIWLSRKNYEVNGNNMTAIKF